MEDHPFIQRLNEIRETETKHLPWSYREAKRLAKERYPELYTSWAATQPNNDEVKEQ